MSPAAQACDQHEPRLLVDLLDVPFPGVATRSIFLPTTGPIHVFVLSEEDMSLANSFLDSPTLVASTIVGSCLAPPHGGKRSHRRNKYGQRQQHTSLDSEIHGLGEY